MKKKWEYLENCEYLRKLRIFGKLWRKMRIFGKSWENLRTVERVDLMRLEQTSFGRGEYLKQDNIAEFGLSDAARAMYNVQLHIATQLIIQ